MIVDIDNESGLHAGSVGSSIVTSATMAENWGNGRLSMGWRSEEGRGKAIDPDTAREAIAAASSVARRLLGNSQSDNPPGNEWSTEVIQNDRERGAIRTTSLQRGGPVKEDGAARLGSAIHDEEVPKNWHLVAHVYTQRHYVERPMRQDTAKFYAKQILGIFITPPGPYDNNYHMGVYNPPQRY